MSDWADIQKAKAEREAALLEQEKQKARNDQKIYKRQLDSILFIKELEKEEAKVKKEIETKQIVNYVKNIKVQDKERKIEDINKQKQYADIIEAHKNIHILTKEQEKMRVRVEDQKYINLMKEKWEEEDQRKKEKNMMIKRQQQEVLKMAEYQNELKSKAAQEARHLESKLLVDLRLQEEKREKSRQDHLNLINLRQQQKQNNYQSILSQTQQKDFQLNQLIANSIQQAEAIKQQQEKTQTQQKQLMKLEAKSQMQQYLQQKEQEKLNLQTKKQKELEEALKHEQQLKHSETVNRLLDQERKNNYRKELNLQTLEAKSTRTSPHALSPIEQKLNRDLIDRKNNFLMQGGLIVASPSRVSPGFKGLASPHSGSKIFF